MSENKNPLQCDSTVAGRQEKSRDNKSLLAYYNPKPGIMSSFLMHGQRNAISRRELESLTGWSGRMVRLMIEKERRAGAPILSDNSNSYFLAENPAELEQFVQSMRNRAAEILKTAQAVEDGGN